MSIWQGFTAFFLPILRDFGVSRTLLSGAFSIRQVESGFLSPLVGYIIDRTSPRKVIISGIDKIASKTNMADEFEYYNMVKIMLDKRFEQILVKRFDRHSGF